MESLFLYLGKGSICLLLFYMIYWLALRKETFFNLNRYYLVFSLLISVLLPLFPLHYTVLIKQIATPNLYNTIQEGYQPLQESSQIESNPINYFNHIALWIYFSGFTITFIRLTKQTLGLLYLVLTHNRIKYSNHQLLENNKYDLPFSFFNIIFLNPNIHKKEDLPDILEHEIVHIREKHWLDLLIIELLTVIFWFNPFIWFYERSIKQNHEYMADRGVISQGCNLRRYQILLVNQLMGVQIMGVTNNLNFALGTTRLSMMTKEKTRKIKFLKLTWALPILGILLGIFAEPVYQVKAATTPQIDMSVKVAPIQDNDPLVIHGEVTTIDGAPLPGASVIVRGSTNGTLSDINGKFTLPIPKQNNGIVVISFVGMQTQVIKVPQDKKGSKIEICMEEGVIEIEDVQDFDCNTPPPPPPPMKPRTKKTPTTEEVVFVVVEEMPHYPGGYYDLAKYMQESVKKATDTNNINGNARVGFTVSKTGDVKNITILESDNNSVAKAATKVISGMQKWNPGKQRGKPVKVNYTINLKF